GGYPMPADDEDIRRKSLVAMAWSEDKTLWDLADDLVTHDELFAMWRSRHVLMVERQIGSKTGPGGSTGAAYLRATLGTRCYPALWDLRSYLWALSRGEPARRCRSPSVGRRFGRRPPGYALRHEPDRARCPPVRRPPAAHAVARVPVRGDEEVRRRPGRVP